MNEKFVVIKITERAVIFGSRMYGFGGEYTVPEPQAREMCKLGQAQFIDYAAQKVENAEVSNHGIGEFSAELKTFSIINTIKENIESIYDLLDEEGRKRVQMRIDNSVQLSEQQQITQDNAGSPIIDEPIDNTVSNTSEAANDTSETASDIPDSFKDRQKFIDAGFDTVEKLKSMTTDDLKNLGFTDRQVSLTSLKISEL